MAKLHYSVAINAPKHKVWHVMLDDQTYRVWTAAFQPNSYYEGKWEKGCNIKFVAEDNGKISGMYGRIVEITLYEYVSIEYLGEIVYGKLSTDENEARNWIGAHENYRFIEENGVTTIQVELTSENMGNEMADMFEGMWPKALEKLKELSEK